MADLTGALFVKPINGLKKFGFLTDTKASKFPVAVMVVVLILSITFILMAILELMFLPFDIFGFVNNGESIGGHIQVVGKIIALVLNKNKFISLISLTKQFWNDENCTEHTRKEILKLRNAILIFQIIFFVGIVFCISSMPITVIFFGKSLPIGEWQFTNQPELHVAAVVVMQMCLQYDGIVLANLDNLFLAFCLELGMQFKILSDNVQQLSVKNIMTEEDLRTHYNKLTYYIRYHKFLIRFLSELKDIFSSILMYQYISVVPLVCSELYACIESPELAVSLRFGITGFVEALQLAIYCIAAEYVSNEASKVSVAIYNSDWYSQYFKILKAPVNLFLQTSQQEVEFMACGMIRINCNALVNVFRVVMSSNALLKSLRDRF